MRNDDERNVQGQHSIEREQRSDMIMLVHDVFLQENYLDGVFLQFSDVLYELFDVPKHSNKGSFSLYSN